MLRVFLLQPYELLFIAARDDNDYNDYDSGISNNNIYSNDSK
jgi:hypothetical protein